LGRKASGAHQLLFEKDYAWLALGIIIAGIVTGLQRTITTARFDFGNVQEFTGILIKSPAPILVSDQAVEGEKILYLVSPTKYGLPDDVAENTTFNMSG
jgi:hypothetical protein